jgi:hypothetical protein
MQEEPTERLIAATGRRTPAHESRAPAPPKEPRVPYHITVRLEGVRLWLVVLLGGALIVDAIVQAGSNATELVVALILLGLVSADPLVAAIARRIDPPKAEPEDS